MILLLLPMALRREGTEIKKWRQLFAFKDKFTTARTEKSDLRGSEATNRLVGG